MKFLPLLQSERGQVARLLLVLAAIVLFVGVITYIIVSMASRPASPIVEEEQVKLPEYEAQLGNIRFVFQSAFDRGGMLRTAEATSTNFYSQKDLTTTERFVIVTTGAQNKGTVNTEQGAWDMGNIVDSAGRRFVPLENYIVNAWLPSENDCGKLLKPAFNPTPCTKIYEVSRESEGLKVEVMTGATNNSASDFSANRRLTHELDLIVK